MKYRDVGFAIGFLMQALMYAFAEHVTVVLVDDSAAYCLMEPVRVIPVTEKPQVTSAR